MRGLYAIADVDFASRARIDVFELARELLRARPAALQLRAKHLGDGDTLTLLRRVVAEARDTGVPVFANDRPDLAVLAGCDGVHVGQDDLTVSEVRRFAKELLVGVSTHSIEQLSRALAERPDYVAFGPVFGTASKERPDPIVGVEGLRRAWNLVGSRRPVVAIGGITLERASEVAAWCDCAAVIGALVPAEGLAGVHGRARALHEVLSGPFG
jgi:thiamine-phosphate pyrophosphorylase